MTPEEYQERAAELCKDTGNVHLYCGLAAEVGEVCGVMQKAAYKSQKPDYEQLFDELGDVLWYVTCLLYFNGFTLADCMKHNIAKLEKRHG
jgi:NTP pyrophosphatase (non-canonical NTP hydrolase)